VDRQFSKVVAANLALTGVQTDVQLASTFLFGEVATVFDRVER
jgi:hypothetical protein